MFGAATWDKLWVFLQHRIRGDFLKSLRRKKFTIKKWKGGGDRDYSIILIYPG
jgi:hypothetical protein